jgi:hypothetical protein
MKLCALQKELIITGLRSVENLPSTMQRADYLDAAAKLLGCDPLASECRVTARCLREAESTQLRLFKSLQPN